LGVCSSARSQVRFSLVPIWMGYLDSSKKKIEPIIIAQS
jgi:hypothetical protein